MAQDTARGEVAKTRILLVDDKPENLRFLIKLLSKEIYSIHAATNGEAALRFARATPPDLILLDIIMPGMDGYQVCKQLKSEPRTRDIPVIFLSADDQLANKEKAFAYGGVDYITKPFQAEEVIMHVKAHLSLYRQKKYLERGVERRSAELARLRNRLADESRDVELLRRTGELAKLGAWELELATMKFHWLDQVYRITEVDPASEGTLEQALRPYAPESWPRIAAAVQACRNHGTPWDFEFPLVTAKGRRIWVRFQGNSLIENGRIERLFGALQDISQSKAATDEIAQLAYLDPLTQLPNRRLLLSRLNISIASCSKRDCHGALIFIDLDNFKTLNDSLGHDQGDLLLQQTGNRIGDCLRENDMVARLGGDEFVVVLEDLDRERGAAERQAQAVGGKILAALSQPFALAHGLHRCTASIGLTLFGQQAPLADELLKQADGAMYQAKKAGRNALCVFQPVA